MAIDVCSETYSSPITSPRISFSHDLKETEFIPVKSDSLLISNPTIDFDFCFHQTFSQNLSSADEIFSNGKILPYDIKKTTTLVPVSEPTKDNLTSQIPEKVPKKKRLIEFLSSNYDSNEDEMKETKPFWQIRRSSSLNCDNGRGNNGILRSLQFLSRSNSTGSAPNQKPKAIQKQRSLKEESVTSVQPFNHNWPYEYKNSKRPNLKKSASKSFRVSPVLNIPPSYIGRGTVSLFGIASLFSGKNSKKKK